VTLTGFLGGDAETRTIKNDVSLTVFSVATKNSWKDPESGEWASRTEWRRCVAFGRLADTTAALNKGDHVHVDRGQLEFRRGQLEFPGHREGEAIQVESDLYGERSAGETAVHDLPRVRGLSQLIAFVCERCGEAVRLKDDPSIDQFFRQA
jgi:single stranded DNA-binding protein